MESQEPKHDHFTLLIGLAAVAIVALLAALMFFGGNDPAPAAAPVAPSDHGHAH